MTGTVKTNEPTGVARDGFPIAKETRLWSLLAAQRDAFLRDGAPSLEDRRSDLIKLKQAILARRRDFEAAINADFGHRSAYETAIMEIMPTVQGIDYLRKNLRRWMRPRTPARRPAVPPGDRESRAAAARRRRHHLALELSRQPLPDAARDRASPPAIARCSSPPSISPQDVRADRRPWCRRIFRRTRSRSSRAAPMSAQAFAALPFDHLVFTGSTSVGRAVMRAASANLVPVTLELGGKSPAIVDRGYSPIRAAKSIAYGKLSNAGQTCIAPDYALVHESQVDAFVAAFEAADARGLPCRRGGRGLLGDHQPAAL